MHDPPSSSPPSPGRLRPDGGEIRWALRCLRRLHGERRWQPRHQSILDALVSTILSQNTSDVNSGRAFRSLKERFPDWEQVRAAPVDEIEDAIRAGGLARIKAERIQSILDQVRREQGETSLEHLWQAPSPQVKEALGRFHGVGPKTIACVLVFTMGRPEFPVDTHVHRISRRLGWVAEGAGAEAAYEHLNPRVPAELKYELHVLMVTHGRRLCRARTPRCGECTLLPRCAYGQSNRR